MRGSYSWRGHHQPQSQDRTLMVQYKAPIRSQALSPMMLGERADQIDRSTQRQTRQSQHGSDSAGVPGHRRLSVPTVTLATHRAAHTVLGQLGLKRITGVLAAPIRVMDQPGLRT